MRTLEAFVILFDLPVMVWGFMGGPKSDWILSFAVLSALTVVMHWLIEGYRWQMIPAYLASLGIAFYSLAIWSHSARFDSVTALWALVLFCGSAVLATVLPVFSLPKPGGRFAVGTTTRCWVARNAGAGDGQDAARLLTVQFWYPTDAKGGKRAPYRVGDATGLKSYLRRVRMHSLLHVPVASRADGFPVVLYSPGWKGHLTQNTIQFEMLASHGFVVMAMEHPPAKGLPEYFDASSEENLRGYVVEARIRAGDVRFILDQLEQVNANDPEGIFGGKLDLSRTGMFGYSFGGAVAVQSCWEDQRIKAGINMDGMMFGEGADAGVRQPFFFMSDDLPVPSQNEVQQAIGKTHVHFEALHRDSQRTRRSLKGHGGYFMHIRGMAHSNYSDRPLYSPLRRLTHAGVVDAKRAIEILNHYTLAFFEQHLNGKSQPLLAQQPSPYGEVQFENCPVPRVVETTVVA